MKNKNSLLKFTNIVLLITMIAIILVSGTYAKYTSTASGTDATVVANWSFMIGNQDITILGDEQTVEFGLFNTINDSDGKTAETDVAKVDGKKLIAPGTSGEFEFVLKNISDVTAKYEIKLSVDNTNIPIEFSFDGKSWKKDLTKLVATDVMAIGSTKGVTVQWRWPFGENETTDVSLGGQEVKVKASITVTQANYIETQVFPDIETKFNTSSIANFTSVKLPAGPFAYLNTELFSGKTITKIGIPVKTVSALDENQTFTLHVIDKEKLDAKVATTLLETYELKLPLSQLGNSTTVNNWVYIDLTDYNITLAHNETLAFSSDTDTVNWGYANLYSGLSMGSEYLFATRITTENPKQTTAEYIFFDIYVKEDRKIEDDSTLKSVLEGKNFSILGDSISTYAGYSNDSTNTNNTIGNNNIYYNGSKAEITSVEQTWWKQAANQTGMNILVNNSWSGDTISNRGITRATQLHDNTGDNAGTNPDIIAVYMGINDVKSGDTVDKFAENYNTMISNIKTAYPDAEIFIFTLVPYTYSSGNVQSVDDETIQTYNDKIRGIANASDTDKVHLVDYYVDSGITFDNHTDYMGDVGLHPNQLGMDKITEAFINALTKKYVN